MSEPAVGTVEEVTLRVTRIRSVSGEVIITPNGQIAQVTNLSRDWARAVIDVPVPSSVDVGHATEVLQRVGRDAYADDRLRKMMLDEPTVMGVERIEVDAFSVRMVARTLPGHAVRRRPGDPRPGRVGIPPGGHHRRGRARHRPRDGERLMTGRPRTSTLVLIGLFLGVLALYILVRPVPAPRRPSPAPPGTRRRRRRPLARAVTPSPARTPSRSPSPSRTASPTRSASPSQSGSPTPSQTATPTGSTPGRLRLTRANPDIGAVADAELPAAS